MERMGCREFIPVSVFSILWAGLGRVELTTRNFGRHRILHQSRRGNTCLLLLVPQKKYPKKGIIEIYGKMSVHA